MIVAEFVDGCNLESQFLKGDKQFQGGINVESCEAAACLGIGANLWKMAAILYQVAPVCW